MSKCFLVKHSHSNGCTGIQYVKAYVNTWNGGAGDQSRSSTKPFLLVDDPLIYQSYIYCSENKDRIQSLNVCVSVQHVACRTGRL